MFEELSKPIAISFWCVNGVEGLRVEQTIVIRIEVNLVDHAPGDDQVVSVFKGNIAQECPECTRASVDEDHLIGIRIFIKISGQ